MGMTKTIESPIAAEIVIDGRRYVNFAGSSYLGLSGYADILEAGAEALRESGAGYQVPRHYQVATRAHQEVETEAARFFRSPAALYLSGGYLFGLVSLPAIRDRLGVIFLDELAHFSLREAAAASGVKSCLYRHVDADDLALKMRQHLGAYERPVVMTDGLFSTFGEIAPLSELASAVAPYDGSLLVDESHSFGVLGATGRGAHEHHKLSLNSVVAGGSLSKAFGTTGGIILGTEEGIAACRSTPAGRGAAAGLPAGASMCAASLRHVRTHPELLQRLRTNVVAMKSGLRNLGLNVGDSVAPIATFVAGEANAMQALQERLMAEGIFVLHSTYIGAGCSGVIRCGIFADHTPEHIHRLLDALRRML